MIFRRMKGEFSEFNRPLALGSPSFLYSVVCVLKVYTYNLEGTSYGKDKVHMLVRTLFIYKVNFPLSLRKDEQTRRIPETDV